MPAQRRRITGAYTELTMVIVNVIDAHITASNGAPAQQSQSGNPQHQELAALIGAGQCPALALHTQRSPQSQRQLRGPSDSQRVFRPRPWMNRGRGRGRARAAPKQLAFS